MADQGPSSPAVRDTPDGAIVACVVVPGASRTEIVGLHGDRLRVRVAAPPEKGRANRALLDLLRDRLDAPAELVTGASGRRKSVLVRGRSAGEVARRLGLAHPSAEEPPASW